MQKLSLSLIICLSSLFLWSCSQGSGYSKYNKFDLKRADSHLPSASAYKYVHEFEEEENLEDRSGQAYKFVSEVALADLQHAVSQYLMENKGAKATTDFPDYSQYFYNPKRKALGKEYSDFLCNIVWKYYRNKGIEVSNKNDIIIPDSIGKFITFFGKRQYKFVSDLLLNLRIPDKFNVNYFDKRFQKVFSKTVLDAIFNAKTVYPNDNYLGHWRALVGFAPSAIRSRVGWREDTSPTYKSSSSSWYEIYCSNTNIGGSDSELSSFIQVQCFSEDLIPVVVGLRNPVYNIDISRDL